MEKTFLLDHGFQISAALDPHRRAAFAKALKHAVDSHDGKPSVAIVGWQASTLLDIVVKKASRIVIIEPDEALVKSIHEGVVAQGWGDDVTLIHEDAKTVSLDEKVDIAVFTHNSTWFMEGPSAAILKNTQKNVLKANGTMIPRRFVHLFELACSPTGINGIALRVPRYGRPGEPTPALGESKHWSTNSVTEGGFPTEVEDTIIVKPLLSGTLTGLRLTTLVELGENNVHLASHSGFQSIFIPLREDVDVKANQPVEIFLKYQFGEGLSVSRCKARALVDDGSSTWDHHDHEVTTTFRQTVREMVANLDATGRGADLDKVVSYTIDPHGDVSRLTAIFWTIDDEFRKPLRDIVEGFRANAAQAGIPLNDDVIYEVMLSEYRKIRA